MAANNVLLSLAGPAVVERVSSGCHASCSSSTSSLCFSAALKTPLLQSYGAQRESLGRRQNVTRSLTKSPNGSRGSDGGQEFALPGRPKTGIKYKRNNPSHQRKGNAATIRAGYFGEFVDDDEKQQKLQAKRRFQVYSSDHIDGESPLQELVSEARDRFNDAVTSPIQQTLRKLLRWWNGTVPGRWGKVYSERRALSVRLYGRWTVFLLFLVFQGSMIGTELVLKHFKVGGLLRPAAVLAVSYVTAPPFIEAFLPGIMKKRDYDPPDPKEDMVFDDEPAPKWRPPEEIAAEEFLRASEEQ